jgi:hypothetical protein
VEPGYSVATFTAIDTELATPVKCPLQQACPGGNGQCEAGYTGPGCQQCVEGHVRFQHHCKPCASTPLSGVMLLLWIVVVVGCSAVLTTLGFEEVGITRQRQVWLAMHGSRFHDLMKMLLDLLSLFTLQLMIPSQLPISQLTGFLAVVGASVSPGVWSPTMCVLPNHSTTLLLPIALLFPMAGLATGASALLAPVVWRKALHTKRSLLFRFLTSFRGLLWSFYPCLLWALANMSYYHAFVVLRSVLVFVPRSLSVLHATITVPPICVRVSSPAWLRFRCRLAPGWQEKATGIGYCR